MPKGAEEKLYKKIRNKKDERQCRNDSAKRASFYNIFNVRKIELLAAKTALQGKSKIPYSALCLSLSQHCSRVAVEVYALVSSAERDSIAELDIIAEHFQLNGSSSRRVHHAIVNAVVGSDGNG